MPALPPSSAPVDVVPALRGMDIDELLALIERIDKVIAKKAPEVKARITALQDTLKTIKGAAKE